MPFKDLPEGRTHYDNDACVKCPNCKSHYLSLEEFQKVEIAGGTCEDCKNPYHKMKNKIIEHGYGEKQVISNEEVKGDTAYLTVKPVSTGYFQVGEMTACGHCKPEQFTPVYPCRCKCHKIKNKTLEKILTARESKMYSYYKSVFEDGCEVGYPIEYDKELIEHCEGKDFIKKARELLPEFIDQEFPKVEHSEDCLSAGMSKCVVTCPRKDYDGSRGRATVEIVNYLIWLEKNL